MKLILLILATTIFYSYAAKLRLPFGHKELLRISLKDLPRPSRIESRIVNGHAANEQQIPHIVGLNLMDGDAGWWCGASIIGNTWILTAAHCTNNAKSVRIYYGSNKLMQAELIHDVDSDNFIQHKEFIPDESLNNDIALIRTPHVDFTHRINKVELADSDQSYAGWWSTACGWGSTANGSDMPEDLQCTDLQIISGDECNNQIGVAENGILCVNTGDGRSTCSGDSGGPLVTHDGAKLVGVSSFVANHCESRLPAGFARVSAYRDWIRENSGIE